MELLPLKTDILRAGDDLAAALKRAGDIRPDDVVVISSKAVATCENAFINVKTIGISKRALADAEKTGRSSAFCQAVADETARMDGRVVGHCPGAMLCTLHPAEGIWIVAANAGMDQSNVPDGTALGWPKDSAASAKRLRDELGCAVIITDSCCTPLRAGITAYALACAGIEPVRDERGTPDLFGKPLRITRDNVVDELSAAANFLMGNAAQATPAAIVRGHGLEPSDFAGWVPTFPPEEDLFKDVIRL
jgi:coenzyme F420-0:L-glutamate ligase/coenzyme F420-1:gamma-L-glutamate ligase